MVEFYKNYLGQEMTPADLRYHARWKPASGHPGGWRVCREFFAPFPYPGLEEATDAAGRVRLFKTYEAARKAAERMRRQ